MSKDELNQFFEFRLNIHVIQLIHEYQYEVVVRLKNKEQIAFVPMDLKTANLFCNFIQKNPSHVFYSSDPEDDIVHYNVDVISKIFHEQEFQEILNCRCILCVENGRIVYDSNHLMYYFKPSRFFGDMIYWNVISALRFKKKTFKWIKSNLQSKIIVNYKNKTTRVFCFSEAFQDDGNDEIAKISPSSRIEFIHFLVEFYETKQNIFSVVFA